jgi:hypothetical protein
MKITILTAFVILSGIMHTANAQVVTAGFNGNYSGIQYTPANGSNKGSLSFGADIGFQIPLSRHWNIITGLGYSKLVTRATLNDNTTYSSSEVDDMGSAFTYRVVTTGYRETQTLHALQVPLQLQFVSGLPENTQWYINAGMKLSLPAKVSIKAQASQLTLSGYYPDYNVEINNLPQHGFGTISNWQQPAQYSLKTACLLSAATGLSFNLYGDGNTRLYLGIYADYGVNNMQSSSQGKNIVSYSESGKSALEANSILASGQVNKVTILNTGIQLKIGFGSFRSATKKEKKSGSL